MAEGMECPECGHQMYAEDEEYDEIDEVNIVTYVCRNGNCKHVEPDVKE